MVFGIEGSEVVDVLSLLALFLFVDLDTPIIRTSSGFTSLIQGQLFTMNCSAIGYPAPSYFWLRNGTNIQNGSTIVLDQLEYKQRGMYKCVASSFEMELSNQVDLAVSCEQLIQNLIYDFVASFVLFLKR